MQIAIHAPVVVPMYNGTHREITFEGIQSGAKRRPLDLGSESSRQLIVPGLVVQPSVPKAQRQGLEITGEQLIALAFLHGHGANHVPGQS